MHKYERGDYIKVEFADSTELGEWMWVRVDHCDDNEQLVFGFLDNQPLSDYDSSAGLGSLIAVSYSKVREHRKPTEFRPAN